MSSAANLVGIFIVLDVTALVFAQIVNMRDGTLGARETGQ